MKNIITAEWVLFGIITVLLVFTMYKAHQIKDKVEYITKTDTVTLTDTITNWNYDTMYFNRYDTINLTDVVILNDTTYIQLPLYTYVFDTTITDTNYASDFRAVVSGFNVTMDSLYLNTIITQQKAVPVTKQRRFVPAVGVGYGTGGFGVFAGVGINIF